MRCTGHSFLMALSVQDTVVWFWWSTPRDTVVWCSVHRAQLSFGGLNHRAQLLAEFTNHMTQLQYLADCYTAHSCLKNSTPGYNCLVRCKIQGTVIWGKDYSVIINFLKLPYIIYQIYFMGVFICFPTSACQRK